MHVKNGSPRLNIILLRFLIKKLKINYWREKILLRKYTIKEIDGELLGAVTTEYELESEIRKGTYTLIFHASLNFRQVNKSSAYSQIF